MGVYAQTLEIFGSPVRIAFLTVLTKSSISLLLKNSIWGLMDSGTVVRR
jgi:hypothetical protein